MLNRAVLTIAAATLAMLASTEARAHKVTVEWKTTDTELVVVAYFDNDLPADDADVELRALDGSVVARGKTNDTGTWKLPKPSPGKYNLSIKALRDHEKIEPITIAPSPPDPPLPATLGSSTASRWMLPVVAAIAGVILVGVWFRRKHRRKPSVTDPPPTTRPVDPPVSQGKV